MWKVIQAYNTTQKCKSMTSLNPKTASHNQWCIHIYFVTHNTTMKNYTSNCKFKLRIFCLYYYWQDLMSWYFICLWHQELHMWKRFLRAVAWLCVCTDVLLTGWAGRSLWCDQSWSQWRHKGDFPNAALHITTKAFDKIRTTHYWNKNSDS